METQQRDEMIAYLYDSMKEGKILLQEYENHQLRRQMDYVPVNDEAAVAHHYRDLERLKYRIIIISRGIISAGEMILKLVEERDAEQELKNYLHNIGCLIGSIESIIDQRVTSDYYLQGQNNAVLSILRSEFGDSNRA